MKFKRSSLTHEEFLSVARRMRAGGVPLFIAEDDDPGSQKPPEGLLISQIGGFTESRVFQISTYMTGFCIDLKITSNVTGPLEIARVNVVPPWPDPHLRLLENPTDHVPESRLYRFPGEPSLLFDIDYVLNKYINDGIPLSRGKSIDGYLLALGGPMTDTFRHGDTIPVILNIWDQFDRKYLASLSLYADRSQGLVRTTPKRARGSLFERPDSVKTASP